MFPLDKYSQSNWWKCNAEVILAFDKLRRAVDDLANTGESNCTNVRIVLTRFASEMLVLISKHQQGNEITQEVESLLQELMEKTKGIEDPEANDEGIEEL